MEFFFLRNHTLLRLLFFSLSSFSCQSNKLNAPKTFDGRVFIFPCVTIEKELI